MFKKKFLVLVIIGCFIGTGVVPSISSDIVEKQNTKIIDDFVDVVSLPPDDELDQHNSDYDGKGYGTSRNGAVYAQSFKPTLNILTRVELIIISNPGLDFILQISIRKSLEDNDLTNFSVEFHTTELLEDWWVFDFPDIKVSPGETYYIVWHQQLSQYDGPGWGYNFPDPYQNGMAWKSNPWDSKPNDDFCFKTYGYNNNPPNKPSTSYKRATDELIITATDSDEDQIRYGVSWDNDGNVDQWTEFYNSGDEASIDCNGRKGTVGLIAEDEFGAQSDWVIQKSKSKAINTLFFDLLENYSLLYQIIQRFLQL